MTFKELIEIIIRITEQLKCRLNVRGRRLVVFPRGAKLLSILSFRKICHQCKNVTVTFWHPNILKIILTYYHIPFLSWRQRSPVCCNLLLHLYTSKPNRNVLHLLIEQFYGVEFTLFREFREFSTVHPRF